MDKVYPIVLLVVAFGLMVLEVFLPSLGILTLGAIAAFAGSILLAFSESTGFGFLILGISAVGAPVLLVAAFRLFPGTSLGRHMILTREKRSTPEETLSRWDQMLGRQGVTRSALRPSGVADFDGMRVDVVTRGEMVEVAVPVYVVEVTGNRIVVRALSEPDPHPDEEEYL